MAQNSQRTAKRRGPGRPFAKGRSPNPGGRPKNEVSITAILRQKIGALRRTHPRAEMLANKLLELAESGDIRALTYLIDRLDGKAMENIALSGEVGLSLKNAQEITAARRMMQWISKRHTPEEVEECLHFCGIEK